MIALELSHYTFKFLNPTNKSTNSALSSDFIVFFVVLWLILYTMIGSNLKYLRKKHNLSQQAFAEILDIPRTTLGDYEREKTEPNIPMLLKMAAYFNPRLNVPPRLEAPPWSSTPISDPLYSVCAYESKEVHNKKVENIFFIVE